MFKINDKKAQAAAELAVFGAILIFLLGTIIRTAAGNSYTQDQNFKVMRMAMLASWNNSKASWSGPTQTARNSAQILFVEDRLSPDFNKYGDMDRNPFIANGSGTFSFELLYPLDPNEVSSDLPIMDVYINGQHFPLTTASYVQNRVLMPPTSSPSAPRTYPPSSCSFPEGSNAQNQCLRNYREWVGGIVTLSDFETVVPVPFSDSAASRTSLETTNARGIYTELANEGYINPETAPVSNEPLNSQSYVNTTFTGTLPATFAQNLYTNQGVGDITTSSAGIETTTPISQSEIQAIQNILKANQSQYKLFYTHIPQGMDQFTLTPPTCSSSPCVNDALTTNLQVINAQGVLGYWNGVDPNTGNHTGDMMFDLQRLGNYSSSAAVPATATAKAIPAGVEANFPPGITSCPNDPPSTNLRCNIAWEWAATPGISADSIGLDPSNNQYPTYDIDGRLKEVTIYAIQQDSNSGAVTLSYEDSQGGDIDSTWDSTSIGPKPGLQPDTQIFTFTKDGTYLQIKEGQLYNPETGQFVRSADKRNTIDLIQRPIQLSNNTGRFCTPPCASGSDSYSGKSQCSSSGATCSPASPCPVGAGNCVTTTTCADGSAFTTPNVQSCVANNCTVNTDPNPVEACVDGISDNCFTINNIAKTCYDTSDNIIFVRSRVEDRRGGFWLTNASGQLKVQ